MRYWAYLAAKLAVASACLYGLLVPIGRIWPASPAQAGVSQAVTQPAAPKPPNSTGTLHVSVPQVQINLPDAVPFAEERPHVAITSAVPAGKSTPELKPLNDGISRLWLSLTMMGWFLLAAGMAYIIVWDQRYRCRICLRRVRMPIETGSWGRMLLLGRPRIEYICTYGHGTLKKDELQISGRAVPEWTPQADNPWDELCASLSKDDDKEK